MDRFTETDCQDLQRGTVAVMYHGGTCIWWGAETALDWIMDICLVHQVSSHSKR